MKSYLPYRALAVAIAVSMVGVQAHAADTMGSHSAPSHRIHQQGSDTESSGVIGGGPRVINPGDDSGYQDDSTLHRTGDGERTNADGSEFETDLDDTSNTTFPGDD
ncbi:MAG: hypothetical protein JKY26_05405 [Pseudomonas sp.]|nr:hypothetical protein [Pseudomonas sp.]